MKLPIALQLYTVRDQAAQDFAGTIRQIAKIGYQSVELAGHPLPLPEMKALFQEVGLQVMGGHVGLDMLENDLENTIAFYRELGSPYITLPSLPSERRQEANFASLCDSLNRIGKACHQHGIQFCYHNHDFEFGTKIGSKTLFDALYAETDPQYVQAQIDVYWVYFAGLDPVALIRKYAGRCPLIHLKDMPKDMRPGERPARFAEVGEGQLNMQAILEASEASGAKWYIVEQDLCERPSLESAQISLQNLRAFGRA